MVTNPPPVSPFLRMLRRLPPSYKVVLLKNEFGDITGNSLLPLSTL